MCIVIETYQLHVELLEVHCDLYFINVQYRAIKCVIDHKNSKKQL
jgi:hypothetical protein